jgi:hypothetical protein
MSKNNRKLKNAPNNKEKNFDKQIIGVLNPPYKDGTHIKYLEWALENLDKGAIIQPASFLINEKPNSRNTQEKRVKTLLKRCVYRIEIRNPNLIFKDASLATPISIIFFDKSKHYETFLLKDYMRNEEWTMDDIEKINKYGNNPLYFSIKKKVLSLVEKKGSFLDIKNREGNFYINFSQIRGHVSQNNQNMFSEPDFFTFVPNNLVVETKKSKTFSIGDETRQESENRLDYLRLKTTRFCLSIYKIHNNIDRSELAIIPDMDFTRSYTDEILASKEFLDLTIEESTFINKNIPDY